MGSYRISAVTRDGMRSGVNWIHHVIDSLSAHLQSRMGSLRGNEVERLRLALRIMHPPMLLSDAKAMQCDESGIV